MTEGEYEVPGELHKQKLAEIARELKSRIPPSMGFTILLYDYSVGNDHGATFYASTADRRETIKLMEEFIEHQKKHL